MSGDDKPWTTLGFGEAQAPFLGPTQRARFWTEGWVARSMFCPNCGAESVTQFPANRRVADFECRACSEEYELKAQRSPFRSKVLDGAYGAKMKRLAADNSPNLLLLKYDRDRLSVTDLFVVPGMVQARSKTCVSAPRVGLRRDRPPPQSRSPRQLLAHDSERG